MNRKWYILPVMLLTVGISAALWADDFVDDIYYTPTVSHQADTVQEYTPHYDRNIKELVFTEETDSIQ